MTYRTDQNGKVMHFEVAYAIDSIDHPISGPVPGETASSHRHDRKRDADQECPGVRTQMTPRLKNNPGAEPHGSATQTFPLTSMGGSYARH